MHIPRLKVWKLRQPNVKHSETWRWNDEVAKAIEEKRRCYKIWHKTKTISDRTKYTEARRNARSVALA